MNVSSLKRAHLTVHLRWIWFHSVDWLILNRILLFHSVSADVQKWPRFSGIFPTLMKRLGWFRHPPTSRTPWTVNQSNFTRLAVLHGPVLGLSSCRFVQRGRHLWTASINESTSPHRSFNRKSADCRNCAQPVVLWLILARRTLRAVTVLDDWSLKLMIRRQRTALHISGPIEDVHLVTVLTLTVVWTFAAADVAVFYFLFVL